MSLTPEVDLQDAIVSALGRLGGSGQRVDVLAQMESDLRDLLTAEDREPVTSRPFEQKWQNNASYARDHMKHSLLPPRADGVWELSAEGWDRYHEILPAPPSSLPPQVDPFALFKPKDSSSYVANIAGRVLTKSRMHEALIASFGQMVAGRGFVPSTAVHPRDLLLQRNAQCWLVEAKVLYNGNAAEAVRGAIGQLFEYRYFFHPGPLPTTLVALFSEPIGSAFVELLESLNIAAVWQLEEGVWGGSVLAARDGLT